MSVDLSGRNLDRHAGIRPSSPPLRGLYDVFNGPAYIKLAAGLLAFSVLSGCAVQPATIAADDEMLCRYSEGRGPTYSQCRTKLEARRVSVAATNALRIEGYALLRTPAGPTEIARRCKDGTAGCDPADVTGTVPGASGHPPQPPGQKP